MGSQLHALAECCTAVRDHTWINGHDELLDADPSRHGVGISSIASTLQDVLTRKGSDAANTQTSSMVKQAKFLLLSISQLLLQCCSSKNCGG